MKLDVFNPFLSSVAAIAALLAAPLAHAADGTWNGITGNWTDAGTWSGAIADGADFTANFTGVDIAADQTITLNGNRTIGNITFTDATTSSNNLIITGNTLTLDRTNPAVPVIDVTQSDRILRISSIVAGNDGLQKDGAGKLTLTEANTFTGTTTINSGTLQIGNGGATGSLYVPTVSGTGNLTFGSASSIVNNGALVYNISGGPVNVNQTISGTGTVSVTGNRSVNFAAGTTINTTGSQTYSATATAATRYYGFTLTDSATVALTSTAGEVSMTGMLGTANGNTGNLNINTSAGNGNVTLNVAVGVANVNFGLNSLNVNAGTGTVSLGKFNSGNWAQVNAISLTGGAVNSTVDMTGFTTLTVNNSLLSTFGGALSGGGALVKSGAGTLNLTASNSYTGTTTINSGGTLKIGGSGRLGGGTYTKAISIASGATLQYSSSAAQNLSGAITGLGGITKDTSGSDLTLSSTSNTYSGTTTISAGRLAITAATHLSSGSTSIVQSGTGQLFINNTTGTFNNPFNISTTGFAESGDSQNNVSGAIRMGSGTAGSMALSNTITLAGNSRISGFLGAPGTLVNTISGQITGGFGIDFYGFQTSTNTAEVFVLSNTANNYTGTTTILNSNYNTTNLTGVSTTLRLGASSVIPDGANAGNVAFAINGTNNNAVVELDLNGFNETINGLTVNAGTFTKRITNSVTGNSVLSIGANDTTSSFSGTITDAGTGKTLGITKIGAGNLTLTNSNNYIGGTIINGGTLTLGHATDTLANTGAVNVNGGTLDLGTNTDTVGALTLTSGSITGTGAGKLTGTGSAFDVRSGTISAKLGGTVGLTKTTAGTVTISSDNSSGGYTGATNVNGGTLIVNGNISTSSLTTVAVGATLGGSGTVGATLINGTLAVGNSPGQMNFTNTLGLAGTTIMEIDGTMSAGVTGGYDFINLTGAGAAGVLTYGGTMTLDMGVVFGVGTYSWNLFDMASKTGTFTGIALADQYSGNLLDTNFDGVWDLASGSNTWQFTESTGVLGLTVVPEPNVAALLGSLGALALLRRRRN